MDIGIAPRIVKDAAVEKRKKDSRNSIHTLDKAGRDAIMRVLRVDRPPARRSECAATPENALLWRRKEPKP
jgi:hypothetical protein